MRKIILPALLPHSFEPEKQTGFLTPRVLYNSDSGVNVGAPFYINLSQNFDTTLKPRLLSTRGVQLNQEVRFLSHAGSSELRGDWLSDKKYDNTRYSYTLKHSKQSRQARIQLLYQNVSDVDYIDDSERRFSNTFGKLSLQLRTV